MLAALISTDIGSVHAMKVMPRKAGQGLGLVINLQVGDVPRIQIFTVHKRCSFSPAGIFFDLFQGQAATSSYVFDVFLDQPRLAKVKAYLVASKLADDVSDRLCAIDITLESKSVASYIFVSTHRSLCIQYAVHRAMS